MLGQQGGEGNIRGRSVSLLHRWTKEVIICRKIICQIASCNPDLELHIYNHFNDEDGEVNNIN